MEVPYLGQKSLHLRKKFQANHISIFVDMPDSMNLKRTVTQWLNYELWSLYNALHLNVTYLYAKFEVTSFYTLEVMPRTKIQS